MTKEIKTTYNERCAIANAVDIIEDMIIEKERKLNKEALKSDGEYQQLKAVRNGLNSLVNKWKYDD